MVAHDSNLYSGERGRRISAFRIAGVHRETLKKERKKRKRKNKAL